MLIHLAMPYADAGFGHNLLQLLLEGANALDAVVDEEDLPIAV